MTIGERIRYFRKDVKKLTQEEFSKRINVGRANVASIEKNRVAVTDRVVCDICNAFSLSEAWLRTGQGEMYEETETTLFAAFAKQYDLSEAEQKAARYLLQLSSEERQQILHHVVGLAEAITSGKQSSSDQAIEAELAAYRQELEAEAAAKKGKSSASDTSSAEERA